MRPYLLIGWLGAIALGCQAAEGPDQATGDNSVPVQNPRDGAFAADKDAGATAGNADGAAAGDADGSRSDGAPDVPFLPPLTWQEHWLDHTQLLKRVSQTDDTAIYFDDDVARTSVSWIQPFVQALWTYTKATYGAPGDGRLYAVFHAGRYEGEDDASIFDATHDHRNVIDLGSADKSFWTTPGNLPNIAYAVGDLVDKSPLGYDTLPSVSLSQNQFGWFFPYDALKAMGMQSEAEQWLTTLMTHATAFPRDATYWSRDWFYPIWLSFGGSAAYAHFIRLVVQHYPKAPDPAGWGQTFALIMNWGEYVHFMSGAAGADLRAMATRAFGWPDSREAEYQQAKLDYPTITY